jgi:hypothetical protein
MLQLLKLLKTPRSNVKRMLTKFCVDCKWCIQTKPNKAGVWREPQCINPIIASLDYVTGQYVSVDCSTERSASPSSGWRKCTADGKLWEPIPKKRTLLERIMAWAWYK